MVLRYFLFLLAAYIVFHKIFPFGLFRMRLADMTGADLLLLIFRSLVATMGAAYFAVTGFNRRCTTETGFGASGGPVSPLA